MSTSAAHRLMHLVFWLPLTFSTPLLVALSNPSDVQVPVALLVLVLGVLTTLATAVTLLLARLAAERWTERIARILLGLGIVAVLQGNVVHDLFYYGAFNGEVVNWRADNGWVFWAELVAFCLAIPVVTGLFLRARTIHAAVLWVPLLSCAVLLAPAAIKRTTSPKLVEDQSFDEGVFDFSDQLNLVHLLPDGLQSDIVAEVLEENPALARSFSGFTLFSDHLGLYQGTAPSLPAMFTGRPHRLELGHDWHRTLQEIEDSAYQNDLADAGFRLDFVTLASPYCISRAQTCVVRPINDLKARGYLRYHDSSAWYPARLVADLTLFRLLPMFFKELVYDDGNWFLADTTADGSSPYPDPVLREWTERMRIVGGPPRYKFYHSIGTHIPAQWDEHCNFVRDLEHNRDNVKKQAVCVLGGISGFLDMLREKEIYDRTAIVITGDHGCNIAPFDLTGPRPAAGPDPGIIGTARPAFLVKPVAATLPLRVSSVPTTMLDVAPTALDLVGMGRPFDGGRSALKINEGAQRLRRFRFYSSRLYWSGDPVPFTEYLVNGPANDYASWSSGRAGQASATPPTPATTPSPRDPRASVFWADPDPVQVCDGSGLGVTTLSWHADRAVEVHVNAPDGVLFSRGGSRGSADTGKWVKDGMTFFLQDATAADPLQERNTIATLTIGLTEAGCPDSPRP